MPIPLAVGVPAAMTGLGALLSAFQGHKDRQLSNEQFEKDQEQEKMLTLFNMLRQPPPRY